MMVKPWKIWNSLAVFILISTLKGLFISTLFHVSVTKQDTITELFRTHSLLFAAPENDFSALCFVSNYKCNVIRSLSFVRTQLQEIRRTSIPSQLLRLLSLKNNASNLET